MRRVWLPLLTAALIGLGAVLPYAAARLQDSENRGERRSFDPSSLLLRQELEAGQVLRLLSGDYVWIEWQSATNLSQEEVRETVSALMEELWDRELLYRPEPGWSAELSVDAYPRLAVSGSTKDLSAVIWECDWYFYIRPPGDAAAAAALGQVDEILAGAFYLDDATGKAVRFHFPAPQQWGEESLSARLRRCLSFLEDYYGMAASLSEPEEEPYDAERDPGDPYVYPILPGDPYVYPILFDMGELGVCRMQLQFCEHSLRIS